MWSESALAAQLAVGIVFSFSAGAKLLDPKAFARGIREFDILPESLVVQATFAVISLESWLGFSHLSGRHLTVAVPVSVALLLSFGVAVSVNLRRGRKIPCHCFGRPREVISVRTVVRILLLMSCDVYLLTMKQFSPPWTVTSVGLPLFWAILLLVLGSWLLSAQDIAVLMRSTERALSTKSDDILSASSGH